MAFKMLLTVVILLDSFSVEFLHEKPVTKPITRAPGLI